MIGPDTHNKANQYVAVKIASWQGDRSEEFHFMDGGISINSVVSNYYSMVITGRKIRKWT